MHSMYGHCGVVLEVDLEDDRIVAADFTVVTQLANSFLSTLIVGERISEDSDLPEKIRLRYLAPSTEAVLVALRTAMRRYLQRRPT